MHSLLKKEKLVVHTFKNEIHPHKAVRHVGQASPLQFLFSVACTYGTCLYLLIG